MQDLEFRQLIERVKLRSPIEVVVGERVTGLRQRGALYWACCPFHQERTPSFAVDPRRATWRCFGACGEGGDVLSFVERFDGISFLESLRLLARQCGEEMPDDVVRKRSSGAEAELEARYDLMRWAADFYLQARRGPDGSAARAYLVERGLAEPVVEAFGIGWAHPSGQRLVEAAQREKKSLVWLADAGLVRRSDGGRPYDFFRGRLLIPIRDRVGRVVGFGGRRLGSEEEGPKYVNTPETPLFHKGRLIFGLDVAASAIRAEHRLLIVEGYTDVMAAHQAGWKTAVAVLGTATTQDHAALVRRSGARSVVLVFDGDEAGRKATLRALGGLLGLPVEIRCAVLPEGRDPGDLLVETDGAEVFRACVDGAAEWFDWCLAGLSGRRGAEMTGAVEERFQLIAKLPQPLERAQRLKELARFLGVPDGDVRAQWQAFERASKRAPAAGAAGAVSAVPSAPARTPRVPSSGTQQIDRAYSLLLGALLLDNSLVPLYSALATDCPEEGELSVLFHTLLELYERDDSGAPIDASAVMTALGDHPARTRAAVLQSQAAEAESAEVLARDSARFLERTRRERELEPLKETLDTAALDSEAATLELLHRELRASRVPTHKPTASPTQ